MESPYFEDPEHLMRRGAIYKFRPIFWLSPPLWVLRNVSFAPPGQANVYKVDQLPDAFRQGREENEENVIARAKMRYLAVLSTDRETQSRAVKTVLVAPLYTLKIDKLPADDLAKIRSQNHPIYYYLPKDPQFSELHECYINFRNLQFLHKDFLTVGKSKMSLTPVAVKSILARYINYLRTE